VRYRYIDINTNIIIIRSSSSIISKITKSKQNMEPNINSSVDDSPTDTLEDLYLYAAHEGNLDRLIELLNRGVYYGTCNGDEWNALHYASCGGHLDVVQYLIDQCQLYAHSGDPWNDTPLHLASREGHLEIVKYLLLIEECQVGVDVKNLGGLTASYAFCKFFRETSMTSKQEYDTKIHRF
jgi:ankyrin repeat protein